MPEGIDDQMARRVIQQTLDLWVKPEIKQRQETGQIPKPFLLTAAQVILDPDSDALEVRLNEEVKVVGELPAEGPVEKGEVLQIDPQKISRLLLTDADPNAGHVTIYAFGPRWLVSFDFRRNATRIQEHILAAEEFIAAARGAKSRDQMRAFAENLFAGVELLARSILLTLPGREILESKKHTTITRRFNWWAGKLGNADPRFAELLNELTEMRDSGRYLKKSFGLVASEADEMLETAEEMLTFARENAPEVRAVN